jgi:centrosomal protein CEP135
MVIDVLQMLLHVFQNVWEQHVEPYQADNARVIKENNELHQQMIRLKETSEQRLREMKAVLRRLEHESTDLKFLNTQYLQRLRTQEKESERKTEKILQLQEKNFQAVIQTPGGKKKNIPFRRQRMEIDCALPDNSVASVAKPTERARDPYVADLLQVADQRMAQLQSLVEKGDKEREELEESLHSMRKLVENREGEIERLTLMLKGGRPAEALAAEGIRQTKERMVAHLNIQVDFLQKATRELEKKLSVSEEEKGQLEGRVTELGAKNARICAELQEIGDLVKQTEQERQGSEQQLKDRIRELKVSII